jgi:hypothetical protein
MRKSEIDSTLLALIDRKNVYPKTLQNRISQSLRHGNQLYYYWYL